MEFRENSFPENFSRRKLQMKISNEEDTMKRLRYITGISGIAVVVAAMALVPAQAQDLRPVHFSGVINDYTPSTSPGGPYEMRGDWSLDVVGGTANFSADFSMETSDYGITGATHVDPTNPATRSPHTHHISMTNAKVSYDTSGCPANSPATTVSGLVVSGTAPTTANGGPAPFDPNNTSTLQVCIMGGSGVSFSNVTLVYTGPATAHFGAQPIHGVVRSVSTK
jgi:hypothetical protein